LACCASLCVLAFPGFAGAQLTISTTGVLPSAPLTESIILGDRLNELRAEWQSPVNAYQQKWVNTINGRANSAPSGGAPANFGAAALDSSIAESAGLRYAMTGNVADLNKSVSALLNAALPPQNENDFITFPELMTSYLSAYDFIRGAGMADLSAATRASIETRLLDLTQSLTNGNNTASNARGKIGATRALAGELLGNQSLLNTGLADLQTHFNYSTTDDGWFTDSQSVYLDYTARHLGIFARAYEQGSGVNLYPALQPLLDMSIAMRKPDGTVPNVSNGLNWPVATQFFTNTPDVAAAGRMLWNMEQLPPNAYDETNINNNDYSYSTSFALTNFSVTPTAPTQSPTFLATGQSAVTVFRNDWSASSDYLMVSPGVDSPFTQLALGLKLPAFHSHNDTGEILVAARGHYILVAAGYNRTDLSNSPAGFTPQSATNHNVILVNNTLGTTNEGRTMRPERFVHTDRLDSTELGGFKGVGDFATLKMTYAGADVSRSSGFANEDYFVVADRMQAGVAKTYGFNLVGRGVRTTLTNTNNLIEVKWEHEGAQVIEHLVSTHDMTLATTSTYMHDEFNQYETTQRMTASVNATQAIFLSVIESGVAGTASRLAITDLSTPEYAAMQAACAADGYVDWILSQAAGALRTAGALTTDAEYAYLRHQAGALDSAMLARGAYLADDGQAILQANHPLTMSLWFSASQLRGTISDDNYTPGSVLDFFHRRILSASLNGQPIAFANNADTGRLFLTGGGALQVEFANAPEPSSLLLLGLGAATISWTHLRRRARAKRLSAR